MWRGKQGGYIVKDESNTAVAYVLPNVRSCVALNREFRYQETLIKPEHTFIMCLCLPACVLLESRHDAKMQLCFLVKTSLPTNPDDTTVQRK